MADVQDISQEFSAYLDGELAAAQGQCVEAAVSADAALAEQLRALRGTRSLLRALGRVAAPEGFVARVLAEAQRRGLLASPPAAWGVWFGRLMAAAVLLVGAAAGLTVLITKEWRRPEAPPAAVAPEPSPVLVQAPLKEEKLPGRAGRGVEPGGPGVARKGGAKDAAQLASAQDSSTVGKRGPGYGAKSGGAGLEEKPAPVPRPSVDALAVLRDKLDEKLRAVAGPLPAGTAEQLDLRVAHLGAARREVQTILAGAGIRQLAASGGEAGGATAAGVIAPGKAAATADLYYEVPAGPDAWRFVVVASGEQSARVRSSLRGILADRRDADVGQRVFVEDATVSQTRPTAPSATPAPSPKPPVIAKLKREVPGGAADSAPYAVAELRRLPAATQPAASQAVQEAQAPAEGELRRLLVITIRASAQAETNLADPLRNVKE